MKALLLIFAIAATEALAERGDLARELIYPVNPPRRVIPPKFVEVQPSFATRIEERLRQWSLLLADELKQDAAVEKELEKALADGLGESHSQVLALEARLGVTKSQLQVRKRELESLQKSLLGSRKNMEGWSATSRESFDKLLAQVQKQLGLFKK